MLILVALGSMFAALAPLDSYSTPLTRTPPYLDPRPTEISDFVCLCERLTRTKLEISGGW